MERLELARELRATAEDATTEHKTRKAVRQQTSTRLASLAKLAAELLEQRCETCALGHYDTPADIVVCLAYVHRMYVDNHGDERRTTVHPSTWHCDNWRAKEVADDTE